MMIFLAGGLIAVLGYLALRRWEEYRSASSERLEIEALQNELALLTGQARNELPSEQIVALTEELRIIVGVERQMTDRGVDAVFARRLSLGSAIDSVANHLALNAIIPD